MHKIFLHHKHIANYDDLKVNIDTLAEYYSFWKDTLPDKDRSHLEKLAKACAAHIATGDENPGITIRDSSADYVGGLLGFNDD